MSSEEVEESNRERRLQILRRYFLPADVEASWLRVKRRMIGKQRERELIERHP